jgi:hypothetical protein
LIELVRFTRVHDGKDKIAIGLHGLVDDLHLLNLDKCIVDREVLNQTELFLTPLTGDEELLTAGEVGLAVLWIVNLGQSLVSIARNASLAQPVRILIDVSCQLVAFVAKLGRLFDSRMDGTVVALPRQRLNSKPLTCTGLQHLKDIISRHGLDVR